MNNWQCYTQYGLKPIFCDRFSQWIVHFLVFAHFAIFYQTKAASAPSAKTATAARIVTLQTTVRDFSASHPDFENGGSGGVVTGLVSTRLGADKKPVFVAANGSGAITSKATFNQWYNDVPGVNQKTQISLSLKETVPNSGIFGFQSDAFFPIDGRLGGDQGYSHNYHFTLESHSRFTFKGGEILQFKGDDDIWVFIDNQLVVDLGGTHGTEPGEAALDSLRLTIGKTYDLDFFFAERHTAGSTLYITTTLELRDILEPKVSIMSPSEGAIFPIGANITIDATATEIGGAITNVDFYAGLNHIGRATQPPFSTIWSNVQEGTYTLVARAADSDGIVTNSQVVNIKVLPKLPPAVEILSPTNNALFANRTNITIIADATDLDGTISRVLFYQATNQIGMVTNAPFSIVWSNVVAGTYTLVAKAIDNDGLMGTSSPISITVAQAKRAPTISLIADQITLEDTPAPVVAFIVSDPEYPTENIFVNAASSDAVLVPAASIVVGGTGTNRTIALIPAKDQFGVTEITLLAQDGDVVIVNRFNLTVMPVNDPPTLNFIADRTINEDMPDQVIQLNGIGAGPTNEIQALRVSATSDNPALISDPSVTYVSPGVSGTLKFQPLPNANGVAHITVTVKDDGGTANGGVDTFSRQFTVTVTPVNDPPTVSISSPANGVQFVAGTNVLIHADAHDIDGTIAKVEFFQGSLKLGEKTAAPYEFDWGGVPAGSYTLTARAFDNDGLSSTSAPVQITVVPLPSISVNDLSIREGDSGLTNVLIFVSLSSSSPNPVTVGYQTVDGSALADQDYQTVSGTLVFVPGETNKAISVPIVGDLVYEPDESFTIVLSGVSGGVIGKDRATITILNDDPLPKLSINNVSVMEGNSGTTDAVFEVSLAGQSSLPVTVDYATGDGTAVAGSDYLPRSGTLTFAPYEGGSGAVVAVADAERPVLRASHSGNAIVMEWNSSGTPFDLLESDSIAISNQSWHKASAQIQFDGTRYSASILATGSLKFYRLGSSAAPEVQEIRVPIVGDLIAEGPENFFVRLTNPSGATLLSGGGEATIIDDDQSAITVDDISVTEGDSGTADAQFTVRLSAANSRAVTVNFATADGTANAGNDYDAISGTLTFAPGETVKTVTVKIHGDLLVESDETFLLKLSNASNASLTRASAQATIIDNDQPSITFADISATEGDSGTTDAVLTVRLSNASTRTVMVTYATQDDTAKAGSDYNTATATLTFVPGETSKTVTLKILGDTVVEPTKRFLVNFSTPVNASLTSAQAVVTIFDNDSPASPPGVSLASPENGDVFPLGSAIAVAANVTPGTSSVDRVDFFANGVKIGSASIAPYTISWSDAALGSYALKAEVFDQAGGSGESTLVNIDVVPNDGQKRVAIVQNFADAEISKMQAWLTDLDLSSKVFNQEGLTFDLLKSFDLVIWDDLGTVAGGLSANDVNLFESLYEANIPLYFIGTKLVGSESNLPANTQLVWSHLIRLNPSGDSIGGNQVTVNDDRHPVNNGPFGLVGSFKLQNDIEPDVARGTGEQVVAGTDRADAVLAEEDSEERTVTQNLLALEGGGVNATVQREKLFKNAVWWLLKLPPPPPFLNLSVDVISDTDTPKVGSELTLTATVQHSGESDATGITMTMVLPSNLAFVSATSEAGTCVFEDGVVICSLGSLTHTDTAAVVIVTKPNALGSTNIITSVSPNQPEAVTVDNSITTTVEVVK